jgi:hypothetical protein
MGRSEGKGGSSMEKLVWMAQLSVWIMKLDGIIEKLKARGDVGGIVQELEELKTDMGKDHRGEA